MERSSFDFAKEEIKRKLSLADLVENYTSLKRSGKGYIGLCPFHDDKNPSFHVDEEKGLYYCFSCGAGGDIFKFLENHKGISFVEAVHELASKLNIKISGSTSKQSHEQSKRSIQLEINKRALQFFHDNLLKNRSSQKARDYLASRSIDIDLAKEFHLGFAEDSWDKLLSCFKNEKISLDISLELGLIGKSEKTQNLYDTFRNRIIFPIIDVDGDVIGFGGRVINDDDKPKYLNSPESTLYKKRKSFYGLHYSKNHIQKEKCALLVEGYMDFLSLYSSGIKNVVATLGTSFTTDHASYLKKYTDSVVILYDGDNSGLRAAVKSGEILLQAGLNPKVAKIPEGSDPDTVVKEEGSSINEFIESAQEVTGYFIDTVLDRFERKEITRSESAEQLAEFGEQMKDPIIRSDFIHKAASRLGFREDALQSMLKSKKKSSYSKQESSAEQEEKNSHKTVDAHEMMILKICINHPDVIGFIDEEFVIHHMSDDNVKKILIKMISEKFEDISTFVSSFQESQITNVLSAAAFSSDEVQGSKNKVKKMLDECMNRLKLKKVREQRILQKRKLDETNKKEFINAYNDLLKKEQTIQSELQKIIN